jgi:hypothetical protein
MGLDQMQDPAQKAKSMRQIPMQVMQTGAHLEMAVNEIFVLEFCAPIA